MARVFSDIEFLDHTGTVRQPQVSPSLRCDGQEMGPLRHLGFRGQRRVYTARAPEVKGWRPGSASSGLLSRTIPTVSERLWRDPYSAPTQVSVAVDFFTVRTLSELKLCA